MKEVLLLFVSAGGLHAQFMAQGKIATQRDFPNTANGHENFARFLKAVAAPAYMLVDLIEEDFRQESVPHLFGSKRAALLQRKLEQFYRGSPFRQATFLQRQKTGRRDDDVLFSALTNPAHITPWLHVMLAQQARLGGIYGVPQISAPVVKDHPSEHLLLVSWQKFSGLRQTYFSRHRLQISRLTPNYPDLPFRDAVVKELARTCQYLKGLSMLPAGEILDVRILCHRSDLQALQARLPAGPDVRYEFADIDAIGRQLNIDYHFFDSDASQLFLQQLAARPPNASYASASDTHHFALWRFKRTINIASAAILAGALLWSAASIWQSSGKKSEAESVKAQAWRMQIETRAVTLAFPSAYASAADMKSAVLAMRRLDQYAPAPADVLKPISAALDRFPQIMLDELAWQMSSAEPIALNAPGDVPAQVAIVKGHLAGFATDYRAMLSHLERFQRDFAERGFQVAALSSPLDLSPSGSIADRHEPNTGSPEFSLKISRRPTNGGASDIGRKEP